MSRKLSLPGLANPLLFVGLLALIGCEPKKPQPVATKPTEVVIETPKLRDVTEYEEFTGHTEARLSVDIRARVSGYLDKAHFKDGEDVKEGQLLFEIDPRTYQATMEQTKAALVQAQARVSRLDRDFDRVTALAKTKVASAQEIDQVTGDRNEAMAAVEAAKANLKLAQTNLEFCRITAPFKGRISRRKIDPGNLCKADDTILTTLVALDPMFVSYDVDERTVLRYLDLIEKGELQSARNSRVVVHVGVADQEGYPLEATINFIDNQVQTTTGTLRVRAELPNPQLRLTPGLFARIRVAISKPRQSLVVPEEALGSDQGRKYLFVLNAKDEVVRRDVKVGAQVESDSGGNRQRAILDGLTLQDRVIVSGLQRVRPGAKVTPKMLVASDAKPASPGTDSKSGPESKVASDSKGTKSNKESAPMPTATKENTNSAAGR